MSLQLIYTDITDIRLNGTDLENLAKLIPPYFEEKVLTSENRSLQMQRLASGLLFLYALRQPEYYAVETVISQGAWGKPVIITPEGLYFNLSHSDSLVLLAVSDMEVGCDIQKIRDGERVAERFFTPEEKLAIDRADEIQKDRLFTRIWTRKESYIKATGEGMRRDLRSFSVMDDVTQDGYAFKSFDIGDYMGSVCVSCGEGYPLDMCDITFTPFQTLVNVIS